MIIISLANKAGLFDKKFQNLDDLKRYDSCVWFFGFIIFYEDENCM